MTAHILNGLAGGLAFAIALGTSGSALAQSSMPPPGETETDHARTVWSPRAYLQLDGRSYPDWAVATDTGRLNHDTVELRRVRIGFDGRWHRASYELTLDPQDFDGTLVKDAYVELRVSRTLRVRAGQFKLPGSVEYNRSARSLPFMERSALALSIAPGRDVGGMLTGQIGRSIGYETGVFAGDGNGRGSRSGLTTANRLSWEAHRDLEVGGAFSIGRTTSGEDSDPAHGLDGRAPSGYRFFERLYVRGLRTRAGLDAQWTPGRWRLAGELLQARDERREQGLDLEDLPSVIGTGWHIAVTKQIGRRQPRVRLRELEVGFRFDRLSFDDAAPATDRDSVRLRATDVRARGADSLTATIAWSPMRWTRLLANVGVERYAERRSAPTAGTLGPYWVLGTRLQLELP